MWPLLSSPLAYVCLPCILWALGHMPSLGLAASWGVGTRLSPTTFSPCGLNHPAPDALGVVGREREGLWEAPPSLRWLLHGPGSCTGRRHPPGPRLRCAPALADAFGLFECCPRGALPRFHKPPQGHQHLARHRHTPPTPHPFPPSAQTVLAPATQGPLRFLAHPPPRQRWGPPAPMAVARRGEPVGPAPRAAVRRRRCSSCEAAHLTTRLQLTPATHCHHQPPGPLHPAALAWQPLLALLDRGGR